MAAPWGRAAGVALAAGAALGALCVARRWGALRPAWLRSPALAARGDSAPGPARPASREARAVRNVTLPNISLWRSARHAEWCVGPDGGAAEPRLWGNSSEPLEQSYTTRGRGSDGGCNSDCAKVELDPAVGLPSTPAAIASALAGHVLIIIGASTMSNILQHLVKVLSAAGLATSLRRIYCVLRPNGSDPSGPWPQYCEHECWDWYRGAAGGWALRVCFMQVRPASGLADMPWARLRRCVIVRELRGEVYRERPPTVAFIVPSVHYIKEGGVFDAARAAEYFASHNDIMMRTFWEQNRGFAADAADFVTALRATLPPCALLVARQPWPTGFPGGDGLWRGVLSPNCDPGAARHPRNSLLSDTFDNVFYSLPADQVAPAAVLRHWEAAVRALGDGVERWTGNTDCVHLRCGQLEHLAVAMLAHAARRHPRGCTQGVRDPPPAARACPAPAPYPVQNCRRRLVGKRRQARVIMQCSPSRPQPWPPPGYRRDPPV
eukprot:TRINITY_DN55681_c0_g1_i1.p1 TRINITY_DN55681_c0_g1~~TRINITY_DN55681_c0_g1_i1.p1  ORF type:complete len:493 (+),score=126.62 TRINITY_DN55681_c0_g1_i1:75-1553(+)